MNKREMRCAKISELRVDKNKDGGIPEIVGHAAVFDSLSQELGNIFPFRERIAKGAFEKSIQTDDIRALFNHDPNYVLGRNKSETLTLEEDEDGLKVKILPPDTAWARDLCISIERGDVSQMSFGFLAEEEDWSDENGEDIRTLKRVRLFDVSPVTFPAYIDTDVGVRSVIDKYNRMKKEREQRDKQIKVKLNQLKQKFSKKE